MSQMTVRGYSILPQDLSVSCTNSYNHNTCSDIHNPTFNTFKFQTQAMPLEAPFQPVNSLLRAEQPHSLPLTEQFYFKTYIIHIMAAEESISFHRSCKTLLPVTCGRVYLANTGAQRAVHSMRQWENYRKRSYRCKNLIPSIGNSRHRHARAINGLKAWPTRVSIGKVIPATTTDFI